MKYLIKFTLFLIFTFIFSFEIQAQNSEWIRVQSNNGEFSIEVPTEHNFFYDKDGFVVSEGSSRFEVKEMNMLNAYPEKTLVSFESYKANKKALDIMREQDKKKGKSSEFKRENYSVKQVVIQTDKSYTVRQYFNSKDYIYILTAASREGETQIMKRFLDSLVFNPNSAEKNPKAIQFANLKVTIPKLDPNPSPKKAADKSSVSKPNSPKDENALPIVILLKHKPAFTDAARFVGADGLIRLRPTFSADGSITKVELHKTLGEGLLRQAVFAVLRMKFLPEEKDGKPQTVTKTVEYNFTLY